MEKTIQEPLLRSVCYLCREGANTVEYNSTAMQPSAQALGCTQFYRMPCECSVMAHPDCFANYIYTSRQKISGQWRIQCTQCLRIVIVPEHIAIQVHVPTESEEDRLIRQRELRCEKIKLWVAVAVQCGMLIGLVLFLTFGYTSMNKM